MSTENTTPAPNPPAPDATPPRRTPGQKLYVVASVVVAIGAVIALAASIFGFFADTFELPGCDSQRAKDTLSDVFKDNKLSPLRYDAVDTVSSSKDEVVCKANLPMPDGGTLVADYSFFWQDRTAKIKYNLSRLPPGQVGKTSAPK